MKLTRDSRGDAEGQAADGKQAPSIAAQVPKALGVRCPRCDEKFTVPEALRGQQTRCKKCSAGFLVPVAKTTPAVGSADDRPALVGIRCPKCQQVVGVPACARGKKAECVKCGAAFLVPRLS